MRADGNRTHTERNAAQIALLRADTHAALGGRVVYLLTHVLCTAQTKHLAHLLDSDVPTTTALLERLEADRLIALNSMDGRWSLACRCSCHGGLK